MLHAPAISRRPARRTLVLSLTAGVLLVALGIGLAWRAMRPGAVPVAPAGSAPVAAAAAPPAQRSALALLQTGLSQATLLARGQAAGSATQMVLATAQQDPAFFAP